MYKIIDLQVELEILRTALDWEFENGSSIETVKSLHAAIQQLEKILAFTKEQVEKN